MATGMYTSAARVVRGGVLVAFEGEVMTMDEAAERGLAPAVEPDEVAELEQGPDEAAEPEQGPDEAAEPEQEPDEKPAAKPRGRKASK